MISIRIAKLEEADALSQIAIAAKGHWNYPGHWMELWLPQLTFSSEYFEQNESWAAEENGTPIAFYTLQDRDGIAWLENLWVLPAYIGKGVGTQLFMHAVELARGRGYKILQLEAEPNALGFYEKIGLHRIGEHQYELDGQPRILSIMEMIL
jgi:GNAT superfamily N-acetyltransferase